MGFWEAQKRWEQLKTWKSELYTGYEWIWSIMSWKDFSIYLRGSRSEISTHVSTLTWRHNAEWASWKLHRGSSTTAKCAIHSQAEIALVEEAGSALACLGLNIQLTMFGPAPRERVRKTPGAVAQSMGIPPACLSLDPRRCHQLLRNICHLDHLDHLRIIWISTPKMNILNNKHDGKILIRTNQICLDIWMLRNMYRINPHNLSIQWEYVGLMGWYGTIFYVVS